MKILVTGATGFVGRAVVRALLARGDQVVAPSRRPIPPQPGLIAPGIAGIEQVETAAWRLLAEGVDGVVHAAGIAHADPLTSEFAFAQVNVLATLRLAEAADAAGAGRFVFLSSIRAQVGPTAPEPVDETCEPAPLDAYGRSKITAEMLLPGVFPEATMLRPVLVAGPEPKGNLALLLRLADSRWPLPLDMVRARRSLASLDNLVAAILHALDAPEPLVGPHIVADAEPLTVGDMVEAMREGLGRDRRLVPVPPRLMRLPLRLAGRSAIWDRVAAPLVVRTDRLERSGWKPRVSSRETLLALASSWRRARA